jgi:hypothetical protein
MPLSRLPCHGGPSGHPAWAVLPHLRERTLETMARSWHDNFLLCNSVETPGACGGSATRKGTGRKPMRGWAVQQSGKAYM